MGNIALNCNRIQSQCSPGCDQEDARLPEAERPREQSVRRSCGEDAFTYQELQRELFAECHRAILVGSVKLEQVLCQIDTDNANLIHGLRSMVNDLQISEQPFWSTSMWDIRLPIRDDTVTSSLPCCLARYCGRP